MTDDLAQIHIDHSGPVVIARVAGEVDISNVDRAKQVLTEAVPASAAGLVLDLSETTHLDSSGIHLVFVVSSELREREQRFCVVASEDAPGGRVLFITGVHKIVPVAPALDEALARVGGSSPETTPG
jgi:anti-anti-sigma factor